MRRFLRSCPCLKIADPRQADHEQRQLEHDRHRHQHLRREPDVVAGADEPTCTGTCRSSSRNSEPSAARPVAERSPTAISPARVKTKPSSIRSWPGSNAGGRTTTPARGSPASRAGSQVQASQSDVMNGSPIPSVVRLPMPLGSSSSSQGNRCRGRCTRRRSRPRACRCTRTAAGAALQDARQAWPLRRVQATRQTPKRLLVLNGLVLARRRVGGLSPAC